MRTEITRAWLRNEGRSWAAGPHPPVKSFFGNRRRSLEEGDGKVLLHTRRPQTRALPTPALAGDFVCTHEGLNVRLSTRFRKHYARSTPAVFPSPGLCPAALSSDFLRVVTTGCRGVVSNLFQERRSPSGRACSFPSEGLTRWLGPALTVTPLAQALRYHCRDPWWHAMTPLEEAHCAHVASGHSNSLSLGMFMSSLTCGCLFFHRMQILLVSKKTTFMLHKMVFQFRTTPGHARKIILGSRSIVVLSKNTIPSCGRYTR